MKPLFFMAVIILISVSCGSDSQNIEYRSPKKGEPIDSHNKIDIYFNGSVNETHGQNIIKGYNIGQKYQCVEFVKRYYYEHLNHEMPNVWGHASQFFDKKLKDGAYNGGRDLKQFANPSETPPREDDILVWDGKFGHAAIVSKVQEGRVEVVQQNVGTSTRINIGLLKKDNKFYIDDTAVLGWLGKR